MMEQLMLLEDGPMAALFALKPLSYVIKLGVAVVAFSAAMNSDRTIFRVLGFAWLVIGGVGLLFVSFQHGTILDALFGLISLGGAGYSWWFTRS